MTIRPLTKELQAKAIAELNEDPNRIRDDLKHLRDWLAKQPHIKARTDDQWLLVFLRGCKFSLERTKQKLDMFYTVRTVASEFFSNRDPLLPEIQEILKLGVFLPLKGTKGPETSKVILFRSAVYDPAKVSVITIFKVNLMIIDILLNEDDQYIIAGMTGVQDMKGVTMAHMTAMTPSLMKKSMTIFQEAYPIRPKALHHIHIPSFFETMFNLFKPLLKEKLLKRMIIHTSENFDELYETVPKSILPREYGGEGGTIQELTDHWKKKVESYGEWFIKGEKHCTNEAKRPGKPKTNDEIFGLEGSFRQLNVD